MCKQGKNKAGTIGHQFVLLTVRGWLLYSELFLFCFFHHRLGETTQKCGVGKGTNESSRLIASHLNFHFLLAAMYARPSKCPFPSSSKMSPFSRGGHDKDPSTCVLYAYSYGVYSGSVPLGRMILGQIQ